MKIVKLLLCWCQNCSKATIILSRSHTSVIQQEELLFNALFAILFGREIINLSSIEIGCFVGNGSKLSLDFNGKMQFNVGIKCQERRATRVSRRESLSPG